MEDFFTFQNLITFLSLSGLEIILGIDNVIFLAIIIYPIPKPRRNRVRVFGITLAIALRIFMLFGVSWVMTLTRPLITIFGMQLTGRSLLLMAGSIFLIIKSVAGIYELVTYPDEEDLAVKAGRKKYDIQNEFKIILQIIFIDLVLSFDSVIVAVGMVNNLYLIIPAIFVAMFVMLASARAIGDFMHSNPSIKILGLAFVLLVGLALGADSFNIEVSKGYIYAAMFFSLFVELLNIKMRKIRAHKHDEITNIGIKDD